MIIVTNISGTCLVIEGARPTPVHVGCTLSFKDPVGDGGLLLLTGPDSQAAAEKNGGAFYLTLGASSLALIPAKGEIRVCFIDPSLAAQVLHAGLSVFKQIKVSTRAWVGSIFGRRVEFQWAPNAVVGNRA
jgi:hypothetical protein